jgi:ankyrin repeat protein
MTMPGSATARPQRAVVLLALGLLCPSVPAHAGTDAASFHRAVRTADGEAVRAWLEAGGDVDTPDRNGRTALQVAVRHGYAGLVGALIAAGADVDARDADGWTALHHAAAAGSPGDVDRLLAAGAAVDAVDPYRYTPLHLAARDGHAAVCERLLDAGADAGRRIDVGFTAADLASDRFPGLAERLRAREPR